MKLFIDANELVAVLNKEYPLYSAAAKVLSLGDKPNVQILTSPVCVAIAFYFASKKSGEEMAKRKVSFLVEHIGITSVDEKCTKRAIQNHQIHDLEDGIQYYSAKAANCDYIITENTGDFYFSEIQVMGSKEFLRQVFKAH